MNSLRRNEGMKTRILRFVLFAALSIVVVCVSSHAQTVVEHSVGSAAASSAAAGATKGVSKSVGDVFQSLTEVLGEAKDSGSKDATSTKVESVTRRPAAGMERPRVRIVQPGQIEVGMARSSLLREFGKPFMKTSQVDGPQLLETYYYRGPDDMVVVTLREGKVTAVSPPPAPEESETTASR